MNLDRATEIVARHVLARAAQTANEWENYPEIGEVDWDFVVTKVEALAPFPPLDDYRAAYEFLTARAEGGESDR
jgi:hypothetical protein